MFKSTRATKFRPQPVYTWSSAIALMASLGAGGALAQDAQYAQQQAVAGGSSLEEIVVTATRRTESVNQVPVSITALSENALEEQSLRSIQDLSSAVPGLFATTSNTANGSSISIRGVSSAIGASTTALYIDDVPLQRRRVNGTASGSGEPYPQLFDLERVEVLRGPQGTLFGQSAQGGAIRFISPTPSLTEYSGRLKASVSGTYHGGTDYEVGGAYGGPIVPDVLGFRASVWKRHDSGYIDHIFAYTGAELGRNTNSQERWAGRIALLWQPTENLRVEPSFYVSRDFFADADSYQEPVPAFTAPANATHPAHTYGPFSLGAYQTIVNANIGEDFINEFEPYFKYSPRTTKLEIANLNLDYDVGAVNIHSSTSYLTDGNVGSSGNPFGDLSSVNTGIPFLYYLPFFDAGLEYDNSRRAFTQELRAASTGADDAFKWVAGVFVSSQKIKQESHDYTINYDEAVESIRGRTVTQVYGAPVNADGDITARFQRVKETQYAAFGEVNYTPWDDLTLIGGVRVSHDKVGHYNYIQGAFFGIEVATEANGGLTTGGQKKTSVLPKFGIQYRLNESQQIYFTAAKGGRVGGANTGSYKTKCASTFAALGIDDTPETYGPDSLWSYEVGQKFRLFGGRAQVNSSLFYIDWKNIQTTYTLPAPCGFSYVTNVGGAVSKGGDVQATVEVVDGLTATGQFSYTDAHYTSAVVGPAPTYRVFVNEGDTLPSPKVTYTLGLRYEFPVGEGVNAYVRGDYRYRGSYKRGFGPGASSHNPFTYIAESTDYVSARVGTTFGNVDASIYVENLFNEQTPLTRAGGGTGAAGASYNPIFTVTSFRPRVIGADLNYRF